MTFTVFKKSRTVPGKLFFEHTLKCNDAVFPTIRSRKQDSRDDVKKAKAIENYRRGHVNLDKR